MEKNINTVIKNLFGEFDRQINLSADANGCACGCSCGCACGCSCGCSV